MSSSVKDIINAIDTLARPFQSKEINEMVGDGTVDVRDNITSMLCYFYKRCIIERKGRVGNSWLYATPEGLTARQAHTRWLNKGEPDLPTPETRPRKKDLYPMPAFALGDWRSKHLPKDPERYARGGL